MKNVFLSYRRSDTEHLAGRMADHLNGVPEIEEVFFDIEDIALTEDFVKRIETALNASDICLVLIGKKWRGEHQDGKSARILEDQDMVRFEVATALQLPARVLPVLANGAAMPQADELPAELAGLPQINGATIQHTSFDRDVEAIIDGILGRKRYRSRWKTLLYNPLLRKIFRSLVGTTAALGLLVLLLGLSKAILDVSLADLNNQGLSWLLIIGIALLGAIIPHFLKRKMKPD